MVLQGVGRIYRVKNKALVYIPTQMAQDSKWPFPFKGKEKTESIPVNIRIDHGRLVVEPAKG